MEEEELKKLKEEMNWKRNWTEGRSAEQDRTLGEMENKWEEEEERSNRGNENSENMGETVKDQRYRKRATSDQTSRVIVNANRSEISCFAVC